MVAARIQTATNLVRRTSRNEKPLHEGRKHARCRVAVRAWLCADAGSQRGYCLDLSRDGARFGGMGTRLAVGGAVICKLMLDERDAPVVVRAEVVRYHATAAACPELCVRFVEMELDERDRLSAFLMQLH